MLQRIRETSQDDDGDIGGLLSGIVEADETYIGGEESNKHGSKKLKTRHGAVGRIAVFGARQRDGKVKASIIENTANSTTQHELRKKVVAGSILYRLPESLSW